MAYEQRGNRQYFYSKVRNGRQVRSVYEGTGIGPDFYALQSQMEAAKKAEERRDLQIEKRQVDALESLVDEACASARVIVASIHLANGYHLHKRQWRRRRG